MDGADRAESGTEAEFTRVSFLIVNEQSLPRETLWVL